MSMAATTTAKLVQPPIPSCSQVVPLIGTSMTKMMMLMMIRSHKPFSTTQSMKKNSSTRFGVGEQRRRRRSSSSGCLLGSEEDQQHKVAESSSSTPTPTLIKQNLSLALKGINRGIFGVPSAKKSEIEGLVKLLESMNPTPDPTLFLDKLGGCWKLVYSTITILGSKRTKLGLRDFISLGDFFQTIDVSQGKAINAIVFNVRGLNLFNGQLKIEASFNIASNSRVDIKYCNSTITPNQLMNVFRKNYELLLDIFNPEGWLEITYVDDTLRIGRDDKGNIFILERYEENKT
ncbi:hypothetical protein LOK49_LG04G01621 [Camellia lanceoleosa]|uniref:Uncharacterized protein n=1 Tax=Camellia lanceoleosa TaxID=1840588 RepID=A0ACC0HZX5_9ERIC|nr:hypothetical protein LOK49_LG04G01621 [Camellia lanceoleosa]